MTAKLHPKHWKFATIHESEMGEFKEIPNTSGTYKISADGVVISRRRRGLPDGFWVVLRNQKSSNAKPFNRVTIFFNGETKGRICQVSRLILEAWVGPATSPLQLAAHRNGITDDDRLDNLTWAVQQEVTHARISRGNYVHGERCHSARLTREQIEAARRIVIEFGVPANLLATAFGLPNTRVHEWLTKCWDDEKWADLKNPLLLNDSEHH